jgi:tetratricopeptide (TPR) repeat protein
LRDLLRAAGPLSEAARNSLVRSLASAIGAAGGGDVDGWLQTLREMPGGALKSEKQLALAMAAWQRCQAVENADALFASSLEETLAVDDSNLPLALIAAYAWMLAGDSTRGGQLLARTGGAASSDWLSALAEAVLSQEPSPVLARVSAANLESNSTSTLLLQAAGLFRSNERERGFQAILAAWRQSPARVPGIFRVSQWVAVLCAASAGSPPPQLLGAVRDLGKAAHETAELDRLAHCAAVLNNQALAVELWRRAVKLNFADASDFARYLCHLGSIEAKAGRREQALEWVREAAACLPATKEAA